MGWDGLVSFKYVWRTDSDRCDATIQDVHLRLRMSAVLRGRCPTSRTEWGLCGVGSSKCHLMIPHDCFRKTHCDVQDKPHLVARRLGEQKGKKLSVVNLQQISHFKMAKPPSCVYIYIHISYIYLFISYNIM